VCGKRNAIPASEICDKSETARPSPIVTFISVVPAGPKCDVVGKDVIETSQVQKKNSCAKISTGVVDEINHKIISDFNPPSTIDCNSL